MGCSALSDHSITAWAMKRRALSTARPMHNGQWVIDMVAGELSPP